MSNYTHCIHSDGFHSVQIKIDGVPCLVRMCEDCGFKPDEKPIILGGQPKVDLRPALARCQRMP